ncbi:MAG: hypothetical protein V8T01_10580 [Oscillospiraceae bacterium]
MSPRKSRKTKTPTRVSSTATTTSPTSRATPTARFPEQTIKRAEMVAMVNRALGRDPQSETDMLAGMKTWKDNADAAVWYYLDIQEATNGHTYARKTGRRILNGTPCGYRFVKNIPGPGLASPPWFFMAKCAICEK